MNKKLLLSLGLASLLTSSIFAADTNMPAPQPMGKHMGMRHGGFHQQSPFMHAVMHLKLSAEQKAKVKEIMIESRKGLSDPCQAFSDTSFDKATFIKLAHERRDNMIEHQADTMEKVYNVLDAAQKKELKVELDKKKDFPPMGPRN